MMSSMPIFVVLYIWQNHTTYLQINPIAFSSIYLLQFLSESNMSYLAGKLVINPIHLDSFQSHIYRWMHVIIPSISHTPLISGIQQHWLILLSTKVLSSHSGFFMELNQESLLDHFTDWLGPGVVCWPLLWFARPFSLRLNYLLHMMYETALHQWFGQHIRSNELSALFSQL